MGPGTAAARRNIRKWCFGREERRMIVYHELSSLCLDLGIEAKTLYALSNNVSSHYHEVKIPKKGGGMRTLHVPDEVLKHVQKRIADQLLACEEISAYAYAYRYGCSAKMNAKRHVNQEIVMRLDIRDFFDHITFAQVREHAFPKWKYSEPLRTLLSVLCIDEDSLPQGSPASPAISNIIMRPFDDVMGEWCRRKKITYTRYCDDLTFSGSFEPNEVIAQAALFLSHLGFFLNEKKTVIRRKGQRQFTTGLIVNESVSVPPEYRRKIRQEMYYLQKYGLSSHLEQISETDEITYLRSLLGRIRYVLYIHSSEEFRNYEAIVLKLTEETSHGRDDQKTDCDAGRAE